MATASVAYSFASWHSAVARLGRFVALDLWNNGSDPDQIFLHDRSPMLLGDLTGDDHTPGTLANNCGNYVDNCYCDTACCDFGDCCPDVYFQQACGGCERN